MYRTYHIATDLSQPPSAVRAPVFRFAAETENHNSRRPGPDTCARGGCQIFFEGGKNTIEKIKNNRVQIPCSGSCTGTPEPAPRPVGISCPPVRLTDRAKSGAPATGDLVHTKFLPADLCTATRPLGSSCRSLGGIDPGTWEQKNRVFASSPLFSLCSRPSHPNIRWSIEW